MIFRESKFSHRVTSGSTGYQCMVVKIITRADIFHLLAAKLLLKTPILSPPNAQANKKEGPIQAFWENLAGGGTLSPFRRASVSLWGSIGISSVFGVCIWQCWLPHWSGCRRTAVQHSLEKGPRGQTHRHVCQIVLLGDRICLGRKLPGGFGN